MTLHQNRSNWGVEGAIDPHGGADDHHQSNRAEDLQGGADDHQSNGPVDLQGVSGVTETQHTEKWSQGLCPSRQEGLTLSREPAGWKLTGKPVGLMTSGGLAFRRESEGSART